MSLSDELLRGIHTTDQPVLRSIFAEWLVDAKKLERRVQAQRKQLAALHKPHNEDPGAIAKCRESYGNAIRERNATHDKANRMEKALEPFAKLARLFDGQGPAPCPGSHCAYVPVAELRRARDVIEEVPLADETGA